MSEYFNNYDFDALMGPADQAFDFGFLDNSNPIGQNEAAGYDYNATYDFDPGMDFAVDPAFDFDFNASFQPGPLLPDATTITDQSSEGSPPTLLIQQQQSDAFSQRWTRISALAFTCQECDHSFNSKWDLDHHSSTENHATWACFQSGCSNRFHRSEDLYYHQSTPHLPSHREVWDGSAIACAECHEAFRSRIELVDHARYNKHSPYACLCGAKFARRDVLVRHLEGFTKESAKYQCTFCKRHRGKQAFRRRDHLVQHLRGYHKMEPEEINKASPPMSRVRSLQILICPHADCEAYRDDTFKALPWAEQHERRPFQKQSEYNKHMRDVHKESAFSCCVAGCDRVGAKGYMREKDLMKHLADKHPEAPNYSYICPEPLKYQCDICGKRLANVYTLEDHRIFVHASSLNVLTN
ncbi:hypothetical protein FHL15_008633 [Xylaria flabelliformis]|uniref:C2H2-type domain-containing protein n=1 Tax=Xylaria flabelliformis TaxID=2512241 RepID=A0A553HR74_9PEZI|nr:hypothetical protein FHL15_008633 [Xylaria flabelliformis]